MRKISIQQTSWSKNWSTSLKLTLLIAKLGMELAHRALQTMGQWDVRKSPIKALSRLKINAKCLSIRMIAAGRRLAKITQLLTDLTQHTGILHYPSGFSSLSQFPSPKMTRLIKCIRKRNKCGLKCFGTESNILVDSTENSKSVLVGCDPRRLAFEFS